MMKRVNLIEYFDLTELLGRVRLACARQNAKAGAIFFPVSQLEIRLRSFIDDDNGFNTCKHVARELASEIADWITRHVGDGASPQGLDYDKLDADIAPWSYAHLGDKAELFNSVFTTECKDIEIYSVGQLAIYRTSALVSQGSHRITEEHRASLPEQALKEFDSAGRCLAFDLPTACGFHALRGVELVILHYLEFYGASTDGLKTWFEYVKAVEEMNVKGTKTSKKVAQMLDRMRDLDRNPLMHPQDTLDTTQADMLFSLAAITVVEMARDMEQREREATYEEGKKSIVNAIAKSRPANDSDAEAQTGGG